jgi:hypothetical protein
MFAVVLREKVPNKSINEHLAESHMCYETKACPSKKEDLLFLIVVQELHFLSPGR